MTSLQMYEAVLIELHKENAPNILLEDFNYFANKAINQYINKRYNIYDISQQTTDDLRVLKATSILENPTYINNYSDLSNASSANYEFILPSDYLHMLNCVCIYKVNQTYKCYNKGDFWRCAATRLTADAYSQVLDNFWNKPSYKRPYYYIHNLNTSSSVPTNPVTSGGTDASANTSGATDGNSNSIASGTGTPKTIKIGNTDYSNVERGAELRYGNVSKVRLEIRYGSDTDIFELKKVYIDYIKVPQYIRLTQSQLDHTEDTSQMLEFPDYVCQEIVNELVHIIMENITDQRLQTHPVVSQSIANPAQQQTEPVAYPQQ